MLTVPPQKYAVLKYKGPNTNIMSAYNDLHKWVEKGILKVINEMALRNIS